MQRNKLKIKNWFITYVGVFALLFAFGLSFQSCSSESSGTTYTIEKQFPSQGVITFLKEVEPNQFKITDEQLVADTSASMVITESLDGTVDTMLLSDLKIAPSQTDTHYARHSSMNSILMGGLMGYWLGRSMSAPLRPSSYSNPNTFNKVNNTSGQTLKSTARTVRSSRPSSSRSGFGKSGSSRSYGG